MADAGGGIDAHGADAGVATGRDDAVVPRSSSALGWAAVGAALYWFAVYVAFHWIRDDLDPCCAFGSNYGRGELEWLMQSAFVVFGFGWMAAGIALHRAIRGARGAAWMLALPLVTGVGLIVSGIWRADDLPVTGDPSSEDMVHTLGGVLTFAGLIAFGIAAWRVLRRSDRWRRLAAPHLWLGLATLVLFLTFSIWAETIGDGFGWWQRALTLVLMPAWLAWLGWQFASVPQRPSQRWGTPTD